MSSTTSTTTSPAYYYEYGVPRLSGLTYTSDDVLSVVLPAVSNTAGSPAIKPFSLKCFVKFGDWLGMFDGDGANLCDDGTTLSVFNVVAPQHRMSYSSTTSTTTSSSTTTTSTSTTSTSTTTTTTQSSSSSTTTI